MIIACGATEVFILDLDKRENGLPTKAWSWKAKNQVDLPPAYRESFRGTDECKPFDGGKKILITSSGGIGAIALIEKETKKTLFYAQEPNSHSADLLPNNRVAVAVSHKEDSGDCLNIYDLHTPEKVIISTDLFCGHGVTWDKERGLLYALGDTYIKIYELKNWESDAPALKLVLTFDLPEGGGHDFSPVPGTPYISLTTSNHCWFFNRDKRELSPHPFLADTKKVKCISHHPKTDRIVFMQASEEHWWHDEIRFLNDEETIIFPEERFYKFRWYC